MFIVLKIVTNTFFSLQGHVTHNTRAMHLCCACPVAGGLAPLFRQNRLVVGKDYEPFVFCVSIPTVRVEIGPCCCLWPLTILSHRAWSESVGPAHKLPACKFNRV